MYARALIVSVVILLVAAFIVYETYNLVTKEVLKAPRTSEVVVVPGRALPDPWACNRT